MNQKQLANVLIKIFGLSLCANRITALVVALFGGLQIDGVAYQTWPRNFGTYLMPLVISAIPLAIGVYFIAQSRWVADKLFGND